MFDASDVENDDPGLTPEQTQGLPRHERDYIIPAQDHKGHHTRLYCRAAPVVGKMLADLVASKKYPFRTVGDAIRYCIASRSRVLLAQAGIPSVLAQADTMISVLVDEEFQIQFLDFFGHLRKVVDTYMEAGSPHEAKRVVTRARAQIGQMPEGYWRDRYAEELIKRHGALIDQDGIGDWDGDPAAMGAAL